MIHSRFPAAPVDDVADVLGMTTAAARALAGAAVFLGEDNITDLIPLAVVASETSTPIEIVSRGWTGTTQTSPPDPHPTPAAAARRAFGSTIYKDLHMQIVTTTCPEPVYAADVVAVLGSSRETIEAAIRRSARLRRDEPIGWPIDPYRAARLLIDADTTGLWSPDPTNRGATMRDQLAAAISAAATRRIEANEEKRAASARECAAIVAAAGRDSYGDAIREQAQREKTESNRAAGLDCSVPAAPVEALGPVDEPVLALRLVGGRD